MRTRQLRHALLVVLAVALVHAGAVCGAWAQTALYWDGDGEGKVGGGQGIWDTTLLRWSLSPTGSTYQAWVNANNDDAVFMGMGGTVSLSGPLIARSLDLQVSGYSFGGAGSLTLAGSSFGTINVAAGVGTMGANLAGTNGFTKTGAGTLVFSFNSTATGNRRILGGAVNINNASRIPNNGTVTLDGGMLVQTNPITNQAFLQSGTALEIGANGGTVSYTGAAASFSTYNGTIRGPGNTLYKVGTGEFRYQGTGLPNTTYSKLVVNEGLFRLGTGSTDERGFGAVPATLMTDAITLDGGAIGAAFAVSLHPNRGITLRPGGGTINTSAGTATIQGPITGSGGLAKTGTNSLTLAAGSDFTGPFTLLDNRVNVRADNALGLGTLVLAVSGNGTLTNDGTADVTLNNPVVSLSSGSIDISATSGRTLTLSGRLTGPAHWRSASGGNPAGTLELSNSTSDFTGGLTIASGRVVISADNALGSTVGGTTISLGASLGIRGGIDYTAPERLTLSGSGVNSIGVLSNIAGDNRFAGPITLAATSTVGVFDGTLELSGPISGALLFSKSGPGTLILSNPGNSYGSLSISGGTVVVSADGNLGSIPPAPAMRIIVGDGTTLRAISSFTIHPNRTLNIVAEGSGIDVASGVTLTHNGLIVGGTLNKIGGGTLALGGSGSYIGPVHIHAGTLSLSSTGSIPNDVLITPAGALRGSGSIAGQLTVGGTISPGAGVGTLPTAGNHTWAGGGTYEWEIRDALGSPGVSWDQLTMSALTITATPGNRFKVKVVALPGKGGPGLTNFDPDSPFSWVIATASSGTVNDFDPAAFEIDTTQFEQNNTNKGGFYVSRSGGDLMLNYVPEPAGAAWLTPAAAALLRRRRRR